MNTQGHNVIRFLEEFLTLGGSYYGQPFKVLDFQREVINDIYRLDDEGRRAHRTYLLGLPRKNAKTTLAAALGVFHLIADDADKAPVAIAAAGDRQQARLVFDEVRRMIQANEDLASVCTVYRNEVKCHRNGGTFRVVSADAGLQQGLNPSFVVIDEYHVHKTAELFDALTLGSATRSQPLTLVISTAGFDLESPLGRLYRYGAKVTSGEIEDPSFGMTWWGPAENEEYDLHDPEVWARFNPAWAHFMNQGEFESAHRRTAQAPFIRYRLNGWTKAENSWLPAGVFEGLASERRLEPGEPVVLGFDGAWQSDSTALVACSVEEPRHIEIIGLWEKPDDQSAMGWRTPVHEVYSTITDAFEKFSVVELAADPWRFEQSLASLAEEGYPVVEFPTGSVQRMTQATQAMFDAVIDGRLSHSGDPALIRHFSNAVLREDARGARVTKDRRGSTRKIDAAVAAIIAHHRAVSWREVEAPAEPQLLVL
jgi:phage terminase large subunit-like protein